MNSLTKHADRVARIFSKVTGERQDVLGAQEFVQQDHVVKMFWDIARFIDGVRHPVTGLIGVQAMKSVGIEIIEEREARLVEMEHALRGCIVLVFLFDVTNNTFGSISVPAGTLTLLGHDALD